MHTVDRAYAEVLKAATLPDSPYFVVLAGAEVLKAATGVEQPYFPPTWAPAYVWDGTGWVPIFNPTGTPHDT